MGTKSVIIIGSGIGGLIAGNLIAKKGHKVTIFESHSAPGGYTAGFYKKGFYFESGTLSFEASASVFKAMKDIGVLDKISFTEQKIRWLSKDFDSIPRSYDDFKKMLYGAFPSEAAKLDKYFAETDLMYQASTKNNNKPFPFLYGGISFWLSIISYIFGARKAMQFIKRYENMTISQYNEQYFDKQSKICRLLNELLYPDMSAWFTGSVLGMYNDYWTVLDGMQSWADVLADNFKKLGGQLSLNSYVEKILTKDGAAVGVSSNNTTFSADYVISACDYKKTFLEMLDDKSLIPQHLQAKIAAAAVSEAVFTVYLGLNISNQQLQKYMKIHSVAYFDLESKADISNPNDDGFFDKCSVNLYSPSMMNPALAPDGKSSLMLMAMPPTGWKDNWGGGDRQKYKQLKEKAKKALLKKAECVIPSLSSFIEFEDAATPLTYERFTHNTGGASSAWSWNPNKKFFPKTMSMNIDTPVKNLYIGSCWANQIGGVPSALIAAYMCSKKIH